LQNARNYRVVPGGPGYVDASAAITPLQVPVVPVDRSMGDIHAMGNPHYLLDPVNAVRVAELIRTTFQQFRPAQRDRFEQRYQDFRRQVAVGLVGEPLADKYDAFKLATLFERGKLDGFLRSQGDEAALGGWLGRMAPYRGTKVVDDHNMWPYFANRFGVEVVGDMEPRPGIPPTTRHLEKLIKIMKAEGVRAILAAPYYDTRHARFVSEATGAKVVEMTHQVEGRPEAKDYLTMVDLNVDRLAAALEARP
jgi:ABC-type Zn uptake system ZnuABC Zn-binding protein ZnuA